MRILIAVDDATSQIVLETALRKRGYEVVAVPDGQGALEVLAGAAPPRIALLDWMMPSPNGIEVCREVRERLDTQEAYIYIILLTGRRNLDEIIKGLEAGADDYVTKPYHAGELDLRIRAGKRLIDSQDALVRAQKQLRLQADHDALTGLLNRGAILRHANVEVARSLREDSPLALALLDIDRFKQINDTHGHQTGDVVLREVAARVQSALRPYDVVGRYGGEEFLAVLPGLSEGDIRPLDRIRTAVHDSPFETGAGDLPVTLSGGVCWRGVQEDIEGLVASADRALHAAKVAGRNRIVQAGDTLQDS